MARRAGGPLIEKPLSALKERDPLVHLGAGCFWSGCGARRSFLYFHRIRILKILDELRDILIAETHIHHRSRILCEKFHHDRPYTLIVVDFSQPIDALVKELSERIAETVPGGLATEVALNLSSGVGKEHMAVLSAVLKSGLALRLVMPGDQEPLEI